MDHMAVLLMFGGTPLCLSQWLRYFCLPPTAREGFTLATCSPTFVVFGSRPSNGGEVISHCSVD